MQYVAIIAAIFTLFKDTFSDLFKRKEVQFILIGLGAYYVYTTTKKKEEREEIQNNLPNNEAALLAQRLFNAFHPLVSEPIFGWYPPDGTDENAVKAIAIQMGKLKNYAAVSEAYKSLFSTSLDADLRSEGVTDLFFNNYNAQSGTTTIPTNPTNPTNNISVMVGSNAFVKQAGVNIRSNSTGQPLRLSTKGENLGRVLKLENKTVGGITGIWAQCGKPTQDLGLYKDYVLVSAQYLTSTKP